MCWPDLAGDGGWDAESFHGFGGKGGLGSGHGGGVYECSALSEVFSSLLTYHVQDNKPVRKPVIARMLMGRTQ